MAVLFDNTIDVLSKSLDMYLVRQGITADNIANVETPGFKARTVEFEKMMQDAVDGEERGIDTNVAGIMPNIVEDQGTGIGQDLNTVDMDKEMAEMTKNDVKYSAATQAVSKKFALLRYAISEGGDK
jgi:flagellar basal-body rod protein FlgB